MGNIFWAESDRDWILNGATVHVSMIGFDDGIEDTRILNGLPVVNIHSDLSSSTDLTSAIQLGENHGMAFQGPVKVGPFDVPYSIARELLRSENLESVTNSDVVKPWINATDITRRSRGMHIIDFGERTLDEASQYEVPFKYVRNHVKPLRDENKDVQRKTNWWRLGRSGGDLKSAKIGKSRYIATPRVSKHRLFVWADIDVVPDSAVVAIARDDDYFLGILQSNAHELWARRKGTQLREAESGFR